MDLETAKLINGRLGRHAMLAAFGFLLATAAIIIATTLRDPALNDVALYAPAEAALSDAPH